MAFQVSPGVQVKEVDLTNVVPAVSSTVGAYAGSFQWGPVDEVVTVSDSNGLIESFFTPANTDAGAEDFYTAESFLKYGSSLRVVRINTTGMSNANAANSASKLLKGSEDYASTYEGGAGGVGSFIARCPGALGNNIDVHVCATSDAYFKGSASLVNDTDGADVGDTTVTVDTGTNFLVRDIITFSGHATQYRVTAINGAVLTIESIGQPVKGGLTVAVADNVAIDRYWEHYALFDKAPGSSSAAVNGGIANDEMHVVVVDRTGVITGTPQTVLETYGFVSKCSDAKDSGGQLNYYRNVISQKSDWIWWSGHGNSHAAASTHYTIADIAGGSAFPTPALPVKSVLSNGSNGNLPTAGQKSAAYTDNFSDADSVDVSFMIVGSTRTQGADSVADHNTIVNQLILDCELRKDCMVIASPRRTSVVNVSSESLQTTNVLADFASVTSSSYASFDSGWVYQYDRFNDRYVWVPGNGHTTGIMVRSDLLRDPWFSPAGFSRGQYLGITKLAYNPKKASRDDLYRQRVNPIVTFAGQGTVLFGDKTALSSPSAFDRINVRRLFIVLEKAIAIAAKSQLFEFNDAFTRAQFRAAVEPFLRDVKNRRGLTDFSVVCDESNNTDTVIDRNEFVCSIFVKPARSINFITLNFVAARSGVDFEEIYSAV